MRPLHLDRQLEITQLRGMNHHPDLFRLHDAKGDGYTYAIAVQRDGGIPGVLHCPACERTWSGGGGVIPSFDVDAHPDRVALRTIGPCAIDEVRRLIAAVRPHVPAWAEVKPGTYLGRLRGTVARKPQDLMIHHLGGPPQLLLSPLLQEMVQERLHARGLGLPQLVPVELEHETRGKPKDLRGYAEVEIPPGIAFHASSYAAVPGRGPGCDVCGWPAETLAVQQFVVAPDTRMPLDRAICRVQVAGEIVVTADCRAAMIACGVPATHFWPIKVAPAA